MHSTRFSEDSRPVSDLKSRSAEVLDQVKKTGRPVLLTRRGRAVAVLLDLHEYEKLVDRARFVDAVEQGISAASSGDLHPNKKAMKILDTFGKGDGK
ncbi:MAG: type II toxin-antitoxin system Phd/YefM family antitoxin [Deltaproteobacteria bacterium]|nr:type II toxin-antitoxin system Phd/YefM family antitoxin [Deltaproteobacteria bacterium]